MSEDRIIRPIKTGIEFRESLEREGGVIVYGNDQYIEIMNALTLDLFKRVAELEAKLERADIK